MESWPKTIDEARRLAEEKPYIESAVPESLPLTGNLLVDAINQSGLGVMRIDQLRKEIGVEQEVICEQLLNMGLKLGRGLDAKGKRSWFEDKLKKGLSFSQINDLLDSLKDSPVS
jgi:hypothetical protein